MELENQVRWLSFPKEIFAVSRFQYQGSLVMMYL